MMKRTGQVITLFGLLMLLATPAFSAAILDFSTGNAGTGGTITKSDGNATGMNLPIDVLVVTRTLAKDGTYDVDGSVAGSTAVGPLYDGSSGSLDFNTLSNTITITGSIPYLGIVNDTTSLLSGSFSSFTITANGYIGSIAAAGPDTKSPDLLAVLGIPSDTQFALFGFSIGINSLGTGSPYTAISSDIVNTELPGPASLFLLGTGMLALAGAARRKLVKKSQA